MAGARRNGRRCTAMAAVLLGAAVLTGAGCFESTPLPPTTDVAWTSVAAGSFHSCGLADDGAAYCWGLNGNGQLGAGPASYRGIVARPQRVHGEASFRSLTAGRFHTCGLGVGGRLYCWGEGGSGQLALDPDSADVGCVGTLCISPLAAPGSDTLGLVQVDAGATHTCGVAEGGDAYCWGDNVWGQLGTGDHGEEAGGPDPVRVASDARFLSVSAGARHTCGLADSGEVWCWGDNGGGQVGTATGETCGSTTDSTGAEVGGFPCVPAPTRVPADRTFRAVAAGGAHTCSLDDGGTAFCWGSDARSALGDGFGSPDECSASPDVPGVPCSREPVRVATDASFTTLAAGDGHACAATASGAARCWGDNGLGQIGYCGVGAPYAPERVCRVDTFRTLAAGGLHSCGVTESGDAWCWGANGEGQLGSGSTRFSYFGPVQVGEASGGG